MTLSPVLPLLIVASCAAETTILASDPRVVPLGRTFSVTGGGIGVSWLGGGASVTHTGSTLRATFGNRTSGAIKVTYSQTNEGFTPWQGVSWVPATNLAESVVIGANGAGTINVVLNMPPQYFGEVGVLESFTSDGDFTQSPSPSRVVHFLGDSITASTNIRGGHPGCGDGGFEADYSSSYAGIVCNFFGATCSTVAVGGKGLVRNCCDNGATMPVYYQQTYYDGPRFPFADAPPQAFVTYLGTNDYNQGENPALDAAFTAAWLALMTNVTRAWYGTPASPANVTFFAVLGPMSPTLPANATLAAVEQGTALGFRIVLVNATTACGLNPDGKFAGCDDGCAGHPGVASHRAIARTLAPIMSAELGWPMPGFLAP